MRLGSEREESGSLIGFLIIAVSFSLYFISGKDCGLLMSFLLGNSFISGNGGWDQGHRVR